MSELETNTVDVRYLSRKGKLIAYGLTENELYCIAPSLRGRSDAEVRVVAETVGTVHGEVWDWSKHGGHSFTLKLHWSCPRCGQQWFVDFADSTPNPTFEPSGCDCVSYWFVHWNANQAASESRA